MSIRSLHAVVAGIALAVLGSSATFASTPIPVPEPASLAILAAGVGALAWVKFRRRD